MLTHKTSQTTHQQWLFRDDEEPWVTITISWRYDPGIIVEKNHSWHGYGRGWLAESVEAVGADGRTYELGAWEYAEALDKGRDLIQEPTEPS